MSACPCDETFVCHDHLDRLESEGPVCAHTEEDEITQIGDLVRRFWCHSCARIRMEEYR